MEKLNLTLEWKGPFGHVPGGSNPWFYEQAELKESAPGVYLQTLLIEDQYFVYYVGQTTSLLRRTCEHIAGYLGGQEWHYDPTATINNKKEKKRSYNPASDQYKEFLTRSCDLRVMAYEWLAALQLFVWIDAKHELDKPGRKLVESALIRKLIDQKKGHGWLCDNGNVSLNAEAGESVELNMKFPNGIQVAGLPVLPDKILYAARE